MRVSNTSPTPETPKSERAPRSSRKQKTEEPKKSAGAEGDVKVELKKEKPAEVSQEKEMNEAEKLMELVNSGKLPEAQEKDAMNRIGTILKKYGKA